MLKFEFMQYTEFSSPEYIVTDEEDGEWVGTIYFAQGIWNFISSASWGLSAGHFYTIADKMVELDESTKSQRILGVF